MKILPLLTLMSQLYMTSFILWNTNGNFQKNNPSLWVHVMEVDGSFKVDASKTLTLIRTTPVDESLFYDAKW